MSLSAANEKFILDTSEAVEVVMEAVEALQALDGREVPTASWGKSKSSAMAAITRELLRVDHLLNRAKIVVMDDYWFVKEPTETPTERATT